MPELPEVETIRRDLAPRLVDRAIRQSGSHWSTKFTPATEVDRYRFVELNRRGKFLIASVVAERSDVDEPDEPEAPPRELVVHLGMTGQLRLHDDHGSVDLEHQHLRAWWLLDSGQTLTFHDIRRFGRIHVVAPGQYQAMPTLHHLGPEPFDPNLDGRLFHRLLSRSRRHLKTNLLSQRPIAGVGNIYADEALWMARINPKVRRLGLERSERLLAAIQEVLALGIDNRGTTLRDYRTADGDIGSNQFTLTTYGRAGQTCLRCNHLLDSVVLDGRTTTWCPSCQAR